MANIDIWEKLLTTQQWLGGALPSLLDNETFTGMQAEPPLTHPRLLAWFRLVSLFSQLTREAWFTQTKYKPQKKN